MRGGFFFWKDAAGVGERRGDRVRPFFFLGGGAREREEGRKAAGAHFFSLCCLVERGRRGKGRKHKKQPPLLRVLVLRCQIESLKEVGCRVSASVSVDFGLFFLFFFFLRFERGEGRKAATRKKKLVFFSVLPIHVFFLFSCRFQVGQSSSRAFCIDFQLTPTLPLHHPSSISPRNEINLFFSSSFFFFARRANPNKKEKIIAHHPQPFMKYLVAFPHCFFFF